MVKTFLASVALVIALTSCATSRQANVQRAQAVALAYLARHDVPLPERYTLSTEIHDYSPPSGNVYPVYHVSLWPPHRWMYGALYHVLVNARSWEAEESVNVGGHIMRLRAAEYRRIRER